jgi:hypothetical protein
VGLTSDEAQGCAALLAATHHLQDVAVPVDDDAADGWRAFTDEAGALREEHTLPRDTPATDVGEPPESLLDAADDEYLHAAATTQADLATLAPKVTHTVRDACTTPTPTWTPTSPPGSPTTAPYPGSPSSDPCERVHVARP